tara:strand:+ start:4956 stop:5609 length:654 start_codon:yes stop_codon:yes gene_type:complete
MEIPNYDNKFNKSDNFKQLYPFMPDSCFRMLICGCSGSGKTNTLMHMLRKPLVYYDKLYLYAKNLEQSKYQDFIQYLNKVAKSIKVDPNDILEYSNNEITDVNDLEPSGQKIVIFDDFICEDKKFQNEITKYFIQGRHKNCCVIYLSQSYYKTPKDIRINCSHYILFSSPSKNENDMICREQNLDRDSFNKTTKQKYDFLYVDKPRKFSKRNFTGNI